MLRREDDHLLRGCGCYLDDVPEPDGTLHLAFVRSTRAHARLGAVETGAAAALPGVVAVETGAAAALPGVVAVVAGGEAAGLAKPIWADYDVAGFKPTAWPAVATERVRYVGEIVAAVLAESPYIAEDALDLVTVEYEALPAVVRAEDAIAPGAPVVHEAIGGNVLFHNEFKTPGVDAVFAAAEHVFGETFHSSRVAAVAMEPRGCLAAYDRGTGALTFWSSTQIPHMLRQALAEHLDWPDTKVRVIAPDVGGGFGMKAHIYPEELLCAALARKFGRAVKWVQDRADDLLTSTQARDHVFALEVAVTGDGVLCAMRARIVVNVGAYAAAPFGSALDAGGGALMIPGPYSLAHYAFEAVAVATHTCPAGAYRGVAQPSVFFAVEGMLDRVARALGIDPAEVRRRNLIKPDELPYVNVMGTRYDTGSYVESLRRALELADYDSFRRNQPASRQVAGVYRGIGIACTTEFTGTGASRYRARGIRRIPGFEGASVKVEPGGKAVAYVSQATQGQGHLTSFAQIAAERLGLDIDDVMVVEGDTGLTPYGSGAWASRGAVAGGGAVLRAADRVRDKMLRLAADVLEVSPADLEVRGGRISLRGSPRIGVSVRQIASIAHAADDRALPQGETYGLEATDYYDPPVPSITNAVHVCCVAVDGATGLVTVERYVVVHDCGRIINPLIVEGQIHGGVAQGLGQALMERIVHGADGQLLTGHLMDYVVPTARDIPEMEIAHIETPSLDTAGGFKGSGESGVIAAVPAIAGAVGDALAGLGVTVNRLPLSPEYVLSLIEGSGLKDVNGAPA